MRLLCGLFVTGYQCLDRAELSRGQVLDGFCTRCKYRLVCAEQILESHTDLERPVLLAGKNPGWICGCVDTRCIKG